MIFAKERVEVIASQLKKQIVVQSFSLDSWQMKEAFYLTPAEADADSQTPWQPFDSTRDHWYGKDRHYWFRTEFTVPEEYDGKQLWLYLRTQIEEWDDAKNPQFLIFVNGVVRQGADMNHRELPFTDCAKAGERFVIDLQAHSGILHPEFRLMADVQERSELVKDLYYDLQVPLWALDRMDKESKTYIDLCTAMNDAINLLDMRRVPSEAFYESVQQARDLLDKTIYGEMAGFDDVIASCIGHTHIDVAWWWTVAQTREKTARSFSTVLKMMEEYPEYRFMSSQPVLYTFLHERYPELYEQLKQRVKEARWEPEGGMWLEADCNLTAGESLVRQFLYGKRFFREEFGVENRVLWLPDVFGYSGALPQIMKKSGIDYFMTTKLSWNQFNKVPNDTMMWEGIDGSRVLTHFISTLGVGQSVEKFFTTYNGMLHPDSIMGGWERYQNKEMNNDILIAYGYGDGGGGPTREMLETGRRMEKGIKGVPKVRQCGALQYFTELEARVKDSRRLPVWTGEFYFEYHRGTYTSMARNKRSNRKSELALRDVELLSVLAQEKGAQYPAEKLEKLWKMVLLNQFHDILPGSSIKEVYEVTREEYAQIAAECKALADEKMKAVAGEGSDVVLFNTLGFARNDLAVLPEGVSGLEGFAAQEADGKVYSRIPSVPSKGMASAKTGTAAKEDAPFSIEKENGGYLVETPFYTVCIDENGMMKTLFDKENQRNIFKPGQNGNRLRVFEDKPIYYDNWDIDVYYTEKGWDLTEVTSMEWTSVGALFAELTIEREFMQSKMRQKIRFYTDSRRIDFDTWVDWHEHQHLLKVFMPADVHTDEATFDIQFGNVTRKTHANTSWDQARFESCGHKWVDVSEGGYGVSLLNDCKYGHSVKEAEIGLTLIKSGIEPNPDTDNEEHFFTYSLYPHAGTWKESDTVKEAEMLNQPVLTTLGAAVEPMSFVSSDDDNVIIETVKASEDGKGVVLRVYENQNKRTNACLTLAREPKQVYSCNLMEEKEDVLLPCMNKISFTILPYEIKTLYIEF